MFPVGEQGAAAERDPPPVRVVGLGWVLQHQLHVVGVVGRARRVQGAAVDAGAVDPKRAQERQQNE